MHIRYVQLGTGGGFLVFTQFPLWRTGAAGPVKSEIIYAF